MVIRNYGVLETWKKEFISTEGAANGNMIFIKPGQCMTVAPENGHDRQHWQIIPQNCWMEKLYPFCKHNYLHKDQYEVLKGLNFPQEKYTKYKYIRWMYMTLSDNMRNAKIREKNGGCGLIHVCPQDDCKKLGCYDHLNMDDEEYNFGKLEFELICNCNYGLKWTDKIGLKSIFQGAIGSYLCSSSSLPSFTSTNVAFMRDIFDLVHLNN